jgi:hypothetical protein
MLSEYPRKAAITVPPCVRKQIRLSAMQLVASLIRRTGDNASPARTNPPLRSQASARRCQTGLNVLVASTRSAWSIENAERLGNSCKRASGCSPPNAGE